MNAARKDVPLSFSDECADMLKELQALKVQCIFCAIMLFGDDFKQTQQRMEYMIVYDYSLQPIPVCLRDS